MAGRRRTEKVVGALGLGTPASGSGRSPIVRRRPGPSPRGTGGVTRPAGVPTSPVRGNDGASRKARLSSVNMPPMPRRSGLANQPLSDPNTDAKTVLSVLDPPCSGRLPRILSNLERKSGSVHQDAGGHALACCHAVQEKPDWAVLAGSPRAIRERKDVSRHVQTRCPQWGQASVGPRFHVGCQEGQGLRSGLRRGPLLALAR